MTGGGEPFRLEVRALNQMHVVAAFGGEAAEAVQRGMVDSISCFLLGDAALRTMIGVESVVPGLTPVRRVDEDLITVDLVARPSAPHMSLLIEGLARTVSLKPTMWGDHCIHVAPSVRASDESVEGIPNDREDSVLNPIEADAPFGGEPVLRGKGWRDRYRRDMAAAARLLEDLAADGLTLAFQPIRMAGRPESLLYKECLLRLPAPGGVARQVGLDIVALERLGLIRALDNHVMWSATDRLRTDPELRLGVNISAQSACLDGWWTGLERRLEAERELAERLTIEITETSAFPSVAAATAFVGRMRALGCRIALDDFGAGRDSIRNLYALQPDIVKVDAFFLRQARQSPKGQAALKSLVGFSRAVGGAVVVEGVETQADSDAGVVAGAAWQQGYFIDPPRLETPEEGREGPVESPPVFGLRSAPPIPSHLESMMPAGAADVIPLQTHFELRWLRWGIPFAALSWALIASCVWLAWRASS